MLNNRIYYSVDGTDARVDLRHWGHHNVSRDRLGRGYQAEDTFDGEGNCQAKTDHRPKQAIYPFRRFKKHKSEQNYR